MTISISRLPARELEPGESLHRMHRSKNGPWFFSGDGQGRFDPTVKDVGACYLALSKLGTWVETFRTSMTIDDVDVSSRSLTTVDLDKSFSVVDLTDRRALAAGVTGAIASGGDYRESHALADDLVGEFDGVMWRLRHDLSQRLVGVALFGAEGGQAASAWPPTSTSAIGPELIREAEDEFGYRVVPAP